MKNIIFTILIITTCAIGAFANGDAQNNNNKQQAEESTTQQKKQQKQERLRAQRQQLEAPIKAKYGEKCTFKWHNDETRIKELDCFWSPGRAINLETEGRQLVEEFMQDVTNMLGINMETLKEWHAEYTDQVRPIYRLSFKQEINGIKVMDSGMKFSILQYGENYKFSHYNYTYPNINLNTTPTLTEEQAVSALTSYFGENFSREKIFETPEGKFTYLLIIPIEGTLYLTYPLYYQNDYGQYVQYFIDAHKGQILKQQNDWTDNSYWGTVYGEVYDPPNATPPLQTRGLENVRIVMDSNDEYETEPGGTYNITGNYAERKVYMQLRDLMGIGGTDHNNTIQLYYTPDSDYTTSSYIQSYGGAGEKDFTFSNGIRGFTNVIYNLNNISTYLQQFEVVSGMEPSLRRISRNPRDDKRSYPPMKWKNYYEDNIVYLFTSRITERIHILKTKKFKMFLVESFKKYLEKYTVSMHGYVIMSNHFHILISAHHGENVKMFIQQSLRDSSIKITTELKGYSQGEFALKAKGILALFAKHANGQAKYAVWKEQARGIPIWTQKVFYAKLDYIHKNLIRAGIVSKPEDYYFSSFRGIYLKEGGVLPVTMPVF